MQRSSRFGGGKFGGNWDGTKRLYHKGHRTFGTGLLSRVIEILGNRGYEIDVTNPPAPARAGETPLPEPGPEWALRSDYQAKIVAEAVIWERGMLKLATGGGKTVIAGHIIYRLSVPTIFFVHTKDLLYQAYDTFNKMFGHGYVGIVGDGQCDLGKTVTICTIQTAARALAVDYEKDSFAEGDDNWLDKETKIDGLTNLLSNCRLAILDECHRVAAPTATNVMSSLRNASWRFGLSASPWRDDGADIVLESVFGEILADINASTLIDMGHLVKPYIRMRYVEPARFPKKTPYATVYNEYIVNNENRNALIVEDAVTKVRKGLQTMVLVRQIGHGQFLRDQLSAALGRDVPFLSGKDSSDTRNAVIGDMRANTLGCLVATTIADEGLDIKPLAGLVLAGGGKSSTRALQRIGRVLRPYAGKRFADVTDFDDNAKYVIEHSAARLKIYATEPNFTIID